MKPSISLLAALAALLAGPALAQTVTDGHTIKMNYVTWRLWGIDAPERKQRCGDYPAGLQATAALIKLMRGKIITCEDRGGDRYGRRIGPRRADGEDLGAAMVRQGQACVRALQPRLCRRGGEGLGVHAHACEPAWQWRAERR
jgi:endonuclease YncB( thermonuclease family)